jgi:hypothetical protein
MPSFVHPALLWGLALVGLPVLIHMINLWRQRRVPWAAMEFLLASQRKNRTWVLLKQLLLLLLRMAAVAAVVLMVAQPLAKSAWSALLGGGRTHHIVLVDDSFSMTDQWAGSTAFERARQAIRRLAANVARETGGQAFTLLRFSQAGELARGRQADLLEEPVGSDFVLRVEEACQRLSPSETAAGPAPALAAVAQLLGEAAGETHLVYVLSDFRSNQWDEPAELRKALERLTTAGARLHLVRCADLARPNLAISALEAGRGTQAAGVPLPVEVAVTNFGTTRARNVSVQLEEDGRTRPAVVVEEVPPGGTVRRRFMVQLPTAGPHRLQAQLPADAVAADNRRFAVLELPAIVPVLIVDGDPAGRSARFLAAALAPGGPVRTGIQPQTETPRFLRSGALDKFAAVYLLDVPQLEAAEAENLEQYVRGGGGVAFFLGDEVVPAAYNRRLYRDGEGLFPVPLLAPADLLVNRLERVPDMEVGEHPLFEVFAGERNGFLSSVAISRYFRLPQGWKPAPESAVAVLARLRNGAPLALERPLEKGRVVVFLSSLAPDWNNWARGNPSFVVAMLELQALLARRQAGQLQREVGAPLTVQLDQARFAPQVRLTSPAAPDAQSATGKAVDNQWVAVFEDTDRSGFYALETISTGNEAGTRVYAYNVAAAEGNLKLPDAEQLEARLEGVPHALYEVADFQYSPHDLAGFNLSDSILYLLVALLVGEQLLAYSASYHPRTKGGLA